MKKMDYKTGHKMTVTANNGKRVGTKLANNGGEVKVRKISNGWIVKEEWKETKSGKPIPQNQADDYSMSYKYKSEETYFEKNPFA